MRSNVGPTTPRTKARQRQAATAHRKTLASDMYAVALSGYLQIHKSLVVRNQPKADALHFAYWVFLAAVIVIAFGAALAARHRPPGTGGFRPQGLEGERLPAPTCLGPDAKQRK